MEPRGTETGKELSVLLAQEPRRDDKSLGPAQEPGRLLLARCLEVGLHLEAVKQAAVAAIQVSCVVAEAKVWELQELWPQAEEGEVVERQN